MFSGCYPDHPSRIIQMLFRCYPDVIRMLSGCYPDAIHMLSRRYPDNSHPVYTMIERYEPMVDQDLIRLNLDFILYVEPRSDSSGFNQREG